MTEPEIDRSTVVACLYFLEREHKRRGYLARWAPDRPPEPEDINLAFWYGFAHAHNMLMSVMPMDDVIPDDLSELDT